MIKVSASLLSVLLLAAACSTPQPDTVVRFNEQDQANLIVRYYTDDTSYLLKPVMKEGPFFSVLKQDAVLEVARKQPGRDLAVVLLIHYGCQSEADAVRRKWRNQLTEMGYQRVVFLGAASNMQVNGLPVLQ